MSGGIGFGSSNMDANPNRNIPWSAPPTVAEIEDQRRTRTYAALPPFDPGFPEINLDPRRKTHDWPMPLDEDDE